MVSCLFGANSYAEDSQKCLECHNEFGEHALHAHSMAPDRMLEKSADVAPASAGQHTTRQLLARIMSPDSRTETGELACSTCHVEHRGAAFDLTKLTNDQCQSCHSGSFHSFADGHPEFSEPQRAFLYFDHAFFQLRRPFIFCFPCCLSSRSRLIMKPFRKAVARIVERVWHSMVLFSLFYFNEVPK